MPVLRPLPMRRPLPLLLTLATAAALLGACSVNAPITVNAPAPAGGGSCAGLKGRPAAKLLVTIRTSQGGPLADQEVSVDRAPMPGEVRQLSCAVADQGLDKVTARTNAQGVATLADVRAGQVRVLAGNAATLVTLAAGEEKAVTFEDGKLVP